MPMVSLLIIVSRTAVSVVSGATASASLRDRYCSFASLGRLFANAKNNFKRVKMNFGLMGIIRTHLVCSRGDYGRHRGTASQKLKSMGLGKIGQIWLMMMWGW